MLVTLSVVAALVFGALCARHGYKVGKALIIHELLTGTPDTAPWLFFAAVETVGIPAPLFQKLVKAKNEFESVKEEVRVHFAGPREQWQ